MFRPGTGLGARFSLRNFKGDGLYKMVSTEEIKGPWEALYADSKTICAHGPGCNIKKQGLPCYTGMRLQPNHLVCGAVLPFWAEIEKGLAIRQRMKICRVRVDEDEATGAKDVRLVGIHVQQEAIKKLTDKFVPGAAGGADKKPGGGGGSSSNVKPDVKPKPGGGAAAFGGTWGGGGGGASSSSSSGAGKAPADVKPSFDSYAYGGGKGKGKAPASGGKAPAAAKWAPPMKPYSKSAPPSRPSSAASSSTSSRPPSAASSSGAASSSAGAASSSARRKFENGDTVTVHGLVAAPQFNGKRGYVDGFNAESGRYTISLFEPVGDRCELLVKEINLSK